jgi:hypothetical protein
MQTTAISTTIQDSTSGMLKLKEADKQEHFVHFNMWYTHQSLISNGFSYFITWQLKNQITQTLGKPHGALEM